MNQDSGTAMVEQAQAMAALPKDVAIMKMENESMMSAAVMRPRDVGKIKTEMTQLMDAFPDFCEQAIYYKPVGKDESGQMKYATGLSIRTAEALREAYGYNRTRAEVSPIDNDNVKVEATFVDYQRCMVWQDAGILSKFYKTRGGKSQRHDDDRFNNLVCKAEVSKRIREVILRSVSPALKAWLFSECETRAEKLLSDAYIQTIFKKFNEIGVSVEMLEKRIRPVKQGWTASDKQILLGLFNAIKDGETTAQEAFGDLAQGTKTNGPVTMESLTKKQSDPSPQTEMSAEERRDLESAIDDYLGNLEWDEKKVASFLKKEFGGKAISGLNGDELRRMIDILKGQK